MLGVYRVDEILLGQGGRQGGSLRSGCDDPLPPAPVVTMAVTLLIISALVFFIIKLPPGDFLTNQIAELRAQGEAASAAKAEFLIRNTGSIGRSGSSICVWIGVMPGPNGFSRPARRAIGAGPSSTTSRSTRSSATRSG